jgi:hypothetical protein
MNVAGAAADFLIAASLCSTGLCEILSHDAIEMLNDPDRRGLALAIAVQPPIIDSINVYEIFQEMSPANFSDFFAHALPSHLWLIKLFALDLPQMISSGVVQQTAVFSIYRHIEQIRERGQLNSILSTMSPHHIQLFHKNCAFCCHLSEPS